MAWERRGGNRYYYRARKVHGRVLKTYLGTGDLAEIRASLDAEQRAQRTAAAEAWAAERRVLTAADGPFTTFDSTIVALARVALISAGFHQHHRGEWRRRRGGNDG